MTWCTSPHDCICFKYNSQFNQVQCKKWKKYLSFDIWYFFDIVNMVILTVGYLFHARKINFVWVSASVGYMKYVIETWLLYITMVKHHLGPPLPENLKPHRNTSKHMGTTHSKNLFFWNSFTGSKIWSTSNGRSLDISANQRSPLFPSILEIRLNASHRNVWCLTSICIGECIQIGCKS